MATSVYLVNDEGQCFEMEPGIHTLGRGELLNIDDKKCSRRQADLEVDSSTVFITPVQRSQIKP